jgi:ribosomal protein RSM22 (predicted rRNA methylase)
MTAVLDWPAVPEAARNDPLVNMDVTSANDYRVLVTGSRNWEASEMVSGALNFQQATARDAGYSRLVVVHGANPSGADDMASDWVKRQVSLVPTVLKVEEPHPADWAKFGKAAGPLRNQEMADSGVHYYLAFIAPCVWADCPNKTPHGSHGATDCVIRAVKARVPGRQYT